MHVQRLDILRNTLCPLYWIINGNILDKLENIRGNIYHIYLEGEIASGILNIPYFLLRTWLTYVGYILLEPLPIHHTCLFTFTFLYVRGSVMEVSLYLQAEIVHLFVYVFPWLQSHQFSLLHYVEARFASPMCGTLQYPYQICQWISHGCCTTLKAISWQSAMFIFREMRLMKPDISQNWSELLAPC